MSINTEALLAEIDTIERVIADIRTLYRERSQNDPLGASKELANLLRLPETQIQRLIDRAFVATRLENVA